MELQLQNRKSNQILNLENRDTPTRNKCQLLPSHRRNMPDISGVFVQCDWGINTASIYSSVRHIDTKPKSLQLDPNHEENQLDQAWLPGQVSASRKEKNCEFPSREKLKTFSTVVTNH